MTRTLTCLQRLFLRDVDLHGLASSHSDREVEKANSPSNPFPRLLSPQMLLFHALPPPKLFAIVDRSLPMPEEPMFVLFVRTCTIVRSDSVYNSSHLLTLCTEVAFAAMVDAIPRRESKYFVKYVLECEVFADEWRKLVGMFGPGYNTVDLLFAKIARHPARRTPYSERKNIKLNRQVTLLVQDQVE